jgi:hypothetical protein
MRKAGWECCWKKKQKNKNLVFEERHCGQNNMRVAGATAAKTVQRFCNPRAPSMNPSQKQDTSIKLKRNSKGLILKIRWGQLF